MGAVKSEGEAVWFFFWKKNTSEMSSEKSGGREQMEFKVEYVLQLEAA